MTDTCTSCGHAAPDHEPHCAWGAPVLPTTIRAAIDPGSRWIAVTITADDAPDRPLRYVDARAFEVGRYVLFDQPQTRLKKLKPIDGVSVEGPLLAYEVDGERVLTEVEAREAATSIVAYLLSHGVSEVVTEHVKNLYGTIPAVGTELLKSSWIYTRVADRLVEQFGIPVRYVLAATWRARLVPLVKQAILARGGTVEGVLIKGKGAALEPVLAEYVAGWPGGATWRDDQVEHVRDSTGLALACALPALPTGKRKAAGARRNRQPGPRVKRKATDELRRAKRLRAKAKRAAARAATSCSCRAAGAELRGRHARTCPMHVAKVFTTPTLCRVCYRQIAAHTRECRG